MSRSAPGARTEREEEAWSQVRQRAGDAVERWRALQAALRSDPESGGGPGSSGDDGGYVDLAGFSGIEPGAGIVAGLPRRQAQFGSRDSGQRRVRQQEETFRAGIFSTVRRLLHWLWVAFWFAASVFWDAVRRRNSIESRARRLRETLQAAGLTAIKVGQQLSMRLDLLSYVYAAELEKLLDDVPPFPVEEAISEIEAAAGKSLCEIFAVFDPKPIGSASIACVYQAVLHSGRRVAVKVRRPGIGQGLAADLRALGILLKFAELFWLPPRFSNNFMRELGTMLFGELDFVSEARAIEIFRERAKEAKLKYVRAPDVHVRYCSRRVLVEDFVSGVWLTEVLAIVETQDEAGFAHLRALDIDPTLIAGRLLRVTRWAGLEGLLFHADLHPANIIVSSGSVLMLVDFGSVGAFTERERKIWRRFLYAQQIEDVGAMARAAMDLLEPLPPIDIDDLISETETVFWQDLYAYRSQHSEWWEKTSARIWMNFLRLARTRNIPMNLNTLRMIRATLLVDTLALRLDENIDQQVEYVKYERSAGKRARKRLRKKMGDMFSVRSFIELEQIFEATRSALYRAQRSLDMPGARYSRLIGKTAYSVIAFFTLVASLFGGTLAVAGGVGLWRRVQGETTHLDVWGSLTDHVLPNSVFQGVAVVGLLIYGRWVYYRLRGLER